MAVVGPHHNLGPLDATLLQVLVQGTEGVHHVLVPDVPSQVIAAVDSLLSRLVSIIRTQLLVERCPFAGAGSGRLGNLPCACL